MSKQDQKKEKLKKDIEDMNVDDLLDESDSDDSDDDDNRLLDGDPDIEKFRLKVGNKNSVLNAAVGATNSTSSKYSSALTGGSSNLTTANSILGTDSSAIKTDLKRNQQQTQQLFTIQMSYPASSALQSQNYKLSKEEKIKAALEYKLSSDSNDSSDEELEKILAQSTASKNKKAANNNINNNNNLNSVTTNGGKNQIISQSSNIMRDGDDEISGLVMGSGSGDFNSSPSKYMQNIANMDIIDIIEKNERMNEVGAEKDKENEGQLLSFDKKFYNVQKKLFSYMEFKDIAKKLHQVNHKFGGMVSAITVVQDYVFVGNSSGIIRVFDQKTSTEMKPLMDDSNIGNNNKVTSLDIADDGGFLISGYKKGQVALWDLVNYKLLKIISDLHGTDVINAKIYHLDENENICAVSCEDSGKVQLIRFNKKILGGYSSEAQFLFKTRLKGSATIAVQKKNPLYPHQYCDNSSLIAFGSLNEIVVCSMRPKIKEIFQINRPNFCKEKSIPYIDWGFGLTPSHRERTVPIMAFAWDRMIQLVYINEQTSTVEMDGFYYSDQEINSLFFMGDSILFVLVNGREVKVLYTTKFHPGHFKFLETAKKDDLLNNPFEKVISVTSHSELEKGFEQPDIKSNLLQCQMVMNYNQSVRKYKSSIFFMCGKTVVKGRLFAWKEYLDHIKFKENADWLNVLKVAIEIYNGELKGFAKVPDEKEIREGILKGFMKDMIKESVQQVIYKFMSAKNQGNNNSEAVSTSNSSSSSTDNYQADSIAIKVAIEFCLSINSTFFLFSEIFQIFQDQGLESKFILNLEPFILAGQFKKELIPEHIIQRIIGYYEEKKNYKVFEKVVQQLDLSDYSQKIDLIVTCEQNCLISALLYLMSSQSEETLGCMQILNNMLKLMTGAKNIEISKEDIFLIQKFESQRKYEIEKSRSYIGYKLFWIMRLFIDGRSYPTGYLTQEKHRIHVYDIVNFITNDYVLDELLQFDSEQFFKVVSRLYAKGVAFRFMEEQLDYLTNNQVKGVGMSMTPTKVINQVFLSKCEGNQIRMDHYFKFLVNVQAQHEYQKPESDPFLFIDRELLLKAILSMIKTNKQQSTTEEEQTLIKAISNKKYRDEELDSMLQALDLQIRSFPQLRIFLVEKKHDFVQSFRLNMANQQLRRQIFEWINKTMSKLAADGGSTLEEESPFLQLKRVVSKSVRELIAINDEECVAMMDRWFEDSYLEQLILEELADYPEIQFNYVKRFINHNEEKIKSTIAEATYSSQKKQEAQRYCQYLVLHTKLLCKYEKDKVHEYVKKDYYPVTECLDVCKEQKMERAVAELLRRNGSFMESLKKYLNIIDKELDRKEMLQEIYQNSKHIKPPNASGTAKLTNKSQIAQAYIFEFLNCQKMPTIHDFDQLLDKAIKIADKQQTVIGEEGWFTILEFLTDYRNSLQAKIFEIASASNTTSTANSTTTTKAQSQQQSQQLLKTKDKQKLDNLKEFVFQRKNMVLRMVPTSISLQTLTQKLNLDFKQIKELYDFKVKAVRNNEKYLKLALAMQEKELLQLSELLHIEVNRGYYVMDEARCDLCTLTLQLAVQRVPLRLFKCSHNYHMNCLKEPQCPKCIKQQLVIESKDPQKKRNRKESASAAGDSKENQNDRNIAFMQAQAEAAFLQSPEKAQQQQLGNMLFVKRLEVFDQQQESLGLSKSSFN